MLKFAKNSGLFLGLFVILFFIFSWGLNTFLGFSVKQVTVSPPQETPGAVEETRADGYHLARVEKVEVAEYEAGGYKVLSRTIDVVLISGRLAGERKSISEDITVSSDNVSTLARSRVNVGDEVVVAAIGQPDGEQYFLADHFRLSGLVPILAFFFALVLFLGRKKGLGSLAGLAFSVCVISFYLVPRLLAGENPLQVGIISSLAIASVSIYLAHGFNSRTSVALLGTIITIGLSGVFAVASVRFAGLFGLGSEDALYLQQLPGLTGLDFGGLLLGGIMIGVLGVLDDITTVQSAAVEELKRANPQLSLQELYKRGTSVGREHITSLVNTLFLAYAGSSLLLFLFFYADRSTPLWVTLNSEFIAEELVRTLVGSVALILAVPITTALAAFFFSRKSQPRKQM